MCLFVDIDLNILLFLYILCTRILVIASEPRCSIISVHFVLINFHNQHLLTLIM